MWYGGNLLRQRVRHLRPPLVFRRRPIHLPVPTKHTNPIPLRKQRMSNTIVANPHCQGIKKSSILRPDGPYVIFLQCRPSLSTAGCPAISMVEELYNQNTVALELRCQRSMTRSNSKCTLIGPYCPSLTNIDRHGCCISAEQVN